MMNRLTTGELNALLDAYESIRHALGVYERIALTSGTGHPVAMLRDEVTRHSENLLTVLRELGVGAGTRIPGIAPPGRYDTIPQAVDAAICEKYGSEHERWGQSRSRPHLPAR